MKQIEEEIYRNWKFLILKSRYKNCEELKKAWCDRSAERKKTYIIIYKEIKNDVVDYDIGPIWTKKYNISTKQKEEIEKDIIELYRNSIWKKEKF